MTAAGGGAETRGYPVVELTGTPDELELATSLLQEHGLLGTSERLAPEARSRDDGRPATMQAYFDVATPLEPILSELSARVPGATVHVPAPLAERDWLAEWKRELRGFPIGERYHVLPSWLARPETDRTVLRIDPEQAFGTGTHETTSLVVDLLERHVASGCSMIDVGAGTGILSMVAALEGARSVLAIESDPAAAACARNNVAENGLSERVEVACRAWESFEALEADVVAANISAAVLTAAVASMSGTLLLSGVLAEEAESFRDAIAPHVIVDEERRRGDWAAFVARPRTPRAAS